MNNYFVGDDTDPLGGQSVSPIYYYDGYVYTGFWNSEVHDAAYVCLPVTDEDPGSLNEDKTALWRDVHLGGFYWAGAVAVGDYLVYGSDDAITAARTAYDALTDAQKALVTNLSLLTAAEAKLKELKDDSGSGSGGSTDGGKKIRVTMRLIGAELAEKGVDLGAEAYLPDYVTWIPTTSYELDEGAKVYDLWVLATQQAGIRSVGAERGYVETVYAPGGYELSEFTNGNRSGWMYTVNGTHPGRGLTNWTLNDGDVVIWHYIVQGTGKGFEPNENITREQIATMLYRYAKTIGLDVSGSAALDKFSDGDKTASWAKDAMQWAVSVGLFQGDDVGTLRPQGDATRAEVAALLMRMVKLIVK